MKVISIVGEKKSGKTSLIEHLIAYLKEYGKVGCIKHAHDLDFGASMKDTTRFFNAGAEVVMGTSGQKAIKICGGKNIKELIEEMKGVDFVLVEGFKSSDLPKIALSDFNDERVSNIIKRIDYSKGVEGRIKEIVELILSLEDY